MKTTSNIAYYVQEGQGTPLVLLHGLCEDSSIWNDIIAAFPNRYIIRIDLPGFGKSAIYGNGSLRAMAEAVHKVLQKEQVKKSILIGHSMGGYVALEYVKKQGNEKISGLGLFHSHPFEDTQERKDIRKKTIAHIDNYGITQYVKQLFEAMTATNFSAKHPEIIKALIEKGMSNSTTGVANALEAMRTRKDTTEILKEVNVPVLFIVGEKDQTVPLKMSLQQLYLPNIADIHILNGVGHLGMVEVPAECKNIIGNFVNLCDSMI